MASHATGKIRIGISKCLLGNAVRYDGGHKHNRFLTDTLGAWVEYVPVCPEVELGLGIPREALQLVGSPSRPRLVSVYTGKDYTRAMGTWARKRIQELESQDLCGFIFKAASPSCGLSQVKVYNEADGSPSHRGTGLFARIFMDCFSLFPEAKDLRLRGLGGLHTRHTLLLMAHSSVGGIHHDYVLRDS